MFNIIVLVLLSALTGVAVFGISRQLRIVASVTLGATLIVREAVITAQSYVFMEQSTLEGLAREAFREGANDALSFCWFSDIYVLLAVVLIVVFCIRGFRYSKST